MKPEHMLLGGGLAFVVGLMAVAMIPDGAWDRDMPNVSAAVANMAEAGAGLAGPTYLSPNNLSGADAGGLPQAPTMMVPDGAPKAWNVAMPGLQPFSRAQTSRFTGRVSEMVVRGKDIGWGQVHVWLTGGPGPAQEVSLAPDWYLKYQGCAVGKNDVVSGVAFRFDVKVSNGELYAQTIDVNGRKCRLRNDEGFALWSAQLQ
jgi:hypothetical protein